MTFGKRLRQLRENKQLSQLDLSKLLNIANSTLSLYEADKRFPEPEVLKRIADFFNVSIDYLLGRTDDPTPPIDDNVDTRGIKLTKKDEKDIAKDLEKIMNDLEHSEGLMFYNEPLTDEDKKLLREAIEFGLRIVKQRNKEKYTPKKYRKK